MGTIAITELGPMGYGTAESPISYKKQRESGELSREVDVQARVVMLSGKALVPVNDNDDGCKDGRETTELYVNEGEAVKTKIVVDNSNHERAKVAGGGYFTGQAISLGVGKKGTFIDEDIAAICADFSSKGVYCGAHTGGNKTDNTSDCGANDKFSLILQNAITYNNQVANTTKILLEKAKLEFKQELFDAVLKNWQAVLDDEVYFSGSTGASRLQKILEAQAKVTENGKPLAVTKHLKGNHNEDYIVVNYVAGRTFSQGVLAQQLREAFPEKDDKHLAQTFVVDVWRIVKLAKAVGGDFDLALYAGVMYQVATAATLTDGTLNIFAYTE
ncbi:MAG: hypothetical protein WAR37_02245 [Candidatus Microsaccharimonas sp.]